MKLTELSPDAIVYIHLGFDDTRFPSLPMAWKSPVELWPKMRTKVKNLCR